ncbi:OsmC family protein [Phreatobacter sp. AB_2022a]|uniref:OsmC family protein n=1 Tax=Phreatobacter sp. AB_2022a TaxID=3003134 RepID=UPI00056DFC42|nr:OsmC family protein [Phreatobacter sp. AB_2022a]MCZ0735802.1 OsmC family protein [Phreatobacter sp. AB_2022a]CEJ14011.1 Peroxiredoxin OsmC [bacterium YEK0313]
MIRSATAVWNGTGRDGRGTLSTQSGVLDNTAYSFHTRFEDGKGTNPEELVAAAHAGCFTMALAFALQSANLTPTELKTTCAVTLDKDGAGFKISKSALTLTATVPGVTQEKFGEIAAGAKAGCPISKLLTAEISLDWTLAG